MAELEDRFDADAIESAADEVLLPPAPLASQ
jgi:hypothetical protein